MSNSTVTSAGATPESLLALEFPSDPQVSPDGRQVAFVLSRVEEEDPLKPDREFARPRYRSHIWLSDGGPAQAFTAGDGQDHSPRWSPDGQTLAFVRDGVGRKGQLYLLPLGGGEARRVTGFKNAVQGLKWSPDGRYVAFLTLADDEDKRDERGEARIITRPRYRFNGLDWLPEVPARLWLHDVQSGEVREWYAPPVGVTAFAWRPDSSGVLLVSSPDELEASQWRNEVFELSLDGEVRPLTHWRASIQWALPHPDGGFVLLGREAGQRNTRYAHLYRFAPDGSWREVDAGRDFPLGNLVGGDCHVGTMPDTPAWLDEATLLVLGTVRGSAGLFRVTLDGTVTPHDHDPQGVISAFTARGGGVALIRESAARFPEVELNGVRVTDLNARVPFTPRAPQRVRFTTDLGEGEGWVLLPDGGPDDRVPALLTIHGGPHTDYGHAFTHEFQLLAARGYGVCYSNPRGSAGYGQAWVDDIHGRWGTVDQDDLLTFFDRCLATLPRLDPARTAVMGGSYGGFMTNWITAHSERFQAAITDRSICNLLSFGGTSDIGLRFWDDELGLNFHRRADQAKLWAMSPLHAVEDVRTPTLIVHSVLDHRCPIEQAEQWYAALTLQGVPVRFVRFPGENHELSRSGRPDRRLTRLHEYLNWLDRWLAPAQAGVPAPAAAATA